MAKSLYTMWMRAITAELHYPRPYHNRVEWMCSQIEKSVAAEKLAYEFKDRLIAELADDLD